MFLFAIGGDKWLKCWGTTVGNPRLFLANWNFQQNTDRMKAGLESAKRGRLMVRDPKSRLSLTPAERKHRALKAAAARWGKSPPRKSAPHVYHDVEPKEAIMLAATKIIAEHGAISPTMRGIADAAGVGLQTVYRMFPTKQDLVIACRAWLVERALKGYDQLIEANRTAETKLCAFALGVSYTYVHPTTARRAFSLLDTYSASIDSGLSPLLKPYWQKYFDIARQMRFSDPEGRVLSMMAMIMGLARLSSVHSEAVLSKVSSSVEAMADHVLAIVFPGIDWPSVRNETQFYEVLASPETQSPGGA